MPTRGAARLLVLLLLPLLAYAAPAAADPVPRPLLDVDFPDPAVVETPAGLVAYATGDRVPHAWSRDAEGPWRRGAALLTHRPSWSREGGVWAVDVARVGGRWLLYYATPNVKQPKFKWVSVGAVCAIVIWVIASIAFAFYVSNFGSYGETYGSIGAVIVLMLWLAVTAFAIILGAEVNSELEAQTARDSTVGHPEPMGARGAVKADHLGEPAAR